MRPDSQIFGDSYAANLIRTMDWSATRVGAIHAWPDALISSVNTILAAPIPMQMFWGPDFLCIYNDAMAPALSDKHPASMGQPAHLVWSEAWEAVGPQMRQVFTQGKAVSFSNALVPVLQNGVLQDRWWTYSYSPVFDEQGQIAGVLDVAQDVTDAVTAERTGREMSARLALAQQIGNIAAWDWNVVTGDFTWDAAGARVYGRPPQAVSRLADIQGFIHTDDLDAVMETVYAALAQHREYHVEFRVCWPNETYHWLSAQGRPVLGDDGTVVRVIGVDIDVTQRRTAEMALRQSEKLAAVGQLASTISHEINNPLEAVTNLLYLASAESKTPEVRQYLSMAEVELRRVSAIANQTLRFHKQQSRPTEISCVDLFTSALLIFQGRIHNAGIQVEKRKRAERPVACLEGEIRQVMNNLIGNAIDAMKQGGRLLVRSAESTNWKTGQKGLRLTVADTGTGMSRKTLNQIFQAFYTTKGINGTGLGLWVSHEIIQRHHGRIAVRSCDQPGKSGTVFSLFLPYDSIPLAGTAGTQVIATL